MQQLLTYASGSFERRKISPGVCWRDQSRACSLFDGIEGTGAAQEGKAIRPETYQASEKAAVTSRKCQRNSQAIEIKGRDQTVGARLGQGRAGSNGDAQRTDSESSGGPAEI